MLVVCTAQRIYLGKGGRGVPFVSYRFGAFDVTTACNTHTEIYIRVCYIYWQFVIGLGARGARARGRRREHRELGARGARSAVWCVRACPYEKETKKPLCAATCVDLGSSGYMIRIRIYVDDNGPTDDRQRMTGWLVIYVGVTRRRQGKEGEEGTDRTGQTG